MKKEIKMYCIFILSMKQFLYRYYYLAHDFIPATNTETTNSQISCLMKALFCSDNQMLYFLFLFSNKENISKYTFGQNIWALNLKLHFARPKI